MLIGCDTETFFTDLRFRDQQSEYERNPVPKCVLLPDGTWEGEVRLMQIGLDPEIINRQYLFDLQALGKELVTKSFKYMLEKESLIVAQNFMYDQSFLALQYDIYIDELRDIMLIAQDLWTGDKLLNDNSEASFSLSALYSRCIPESLFIALTGKTPKEYEQFKKENQKSDWSGYLDDTQLEYAAHDAWLPFYVYRYLQEEIKKFTKAHPQSKIWDSIKLAGAFSLECALSHSIGIGFDADYHKNELIPELETCVYNAIEKLEKIPEMWIIVRGKKIEAAKTRPYMKWSYEFAHPSKNAKLGRAVVENLGYQLPKTESGKDWSVGGGALDELFWESSPSKQRDILELILQAKTAQTYLDKNGETYLKFTHEDGRHHPSIFQRGSEEGAIETSRMSFQKPALQTIPNDPFPLFQGYHKTPAQMFRRSFVAQPGIRDGEEHTLVDGDFSNEEVRVITVQSRDPVLIKGFKNDEDLHQKTADNLGVPRPSGKLFFLSSQYGAYPKRIRRSVYLDSRGEFKASLEEVTIMREKHFELYAGLKDHHTKCERDVDKVLEPHPTLCDFAGRKPIYVRFTPYYKIHRRWCLSKEQELTAHKMIREGKVGTKDDYLRKNIEVLNPNTGKTSTFANQYNKRRGEIIREAFNFDVQGDCAVVIKRAAVRIGREFRSRGWHPYDACIVIYAHDEILSDVRMDLKEEAAEIMVRCMKDVLDEPLQGVIPSKISINSGENWYVAAPK